MTRTPLPVARAESRAVAYAPFARGSGRARTIAAVVPLGVLALVLALHRAWALDGPAPVVAALLGAIFAGGLARARPELSTRQARVALGAALGITAMYVILPSFTPPGERIVPSAFSAAVPALVGWSLVLWLPGVGVRTSENVEAWRWLRTPPATLLAGAAVAYLAILAFLLHDAAGSYVVLQDEALYTVQAGLLGHEGFGWRMPPDYIPFFRPEYALYRNGILTTQYAPGWPAMLAAFDSLGLRWWANPVLAVLTVAMAFWIGRRLHSPFAGVVAALLVGTQEWFVYEATGSMPHVGTAAALTAATAMLLASETAGPRARVALRVLAGSSLGLAVATRPLTGVAIGASIGIWMIARGGWRPAHLLQLGIPVGLGLAVPAAFVLYYNAITTGDPLVFGYKAVHGPLHDLGFGLRGYRYYYGALDPVVRANPFTFELALRHLHARSWLFARELLPVFLVLPVLWLAIARGARIRAGIVGAFLFLPVAYFFYFSSSTRFYVELIPFAMIGLALLVAQLAAADWRRTAAPLLGLLALMGAVRLTTIDRPGDWVWQRVVASAGQLEAAHARLGPLLVFIEEPLPEAYLFRRLWQFNSDGFESPILVARSQGARDLELARAFPRRTALRGVWRGGASRPMVLSPLRE